MRHIRTIGAYYVWGAAAQPTGEKVDGRDMIVLGRKIWEKILSIGFFVNQEDALYGVAHGFQCIETVDCRCHWDRSTICLLTYLREPAIHPFTLMQTVRLPVR
jgi:hypothetical protein